MLWIGANTPVAPAGLSFTLSEGTHRTSVVTQWSPHVQSSCGRPQKWVWVCFRGLWWFMTPFKAWKLPWGVEPVTPFQKVWTPSGLLVNVPVLLCRQSLHLSHLCMEEHWYDNNALSYLTGSASYWPLPLPGSNPSFLQNKGWFVVTILWCSPPLHLGCYPAHCQQSTHCFCKWPVFWAINQ